MYECIFIRYYTLHGLNFIVQCENKALADESELLFSYLPFEISESPDTTSPVLIKFQPSKKPAPFPNDGLRPYTVNEILIFDSKKSVIITDNYTTFRFKPGAGTGIFSIHPSFSKKGLASKYNFFLLGLTYLFSYQGLFDLHGAALYNHELGYLFLGQSKSGKSSIALSLVCNGWRYASDDSLLIKSNGRDVEVLSFRKQFFIDPKIISKYPELNSKITTETNITGKKHFLNLDAIYPERFQSSIFPSCLIFSEIVTDQKSSIQSISKGQAFTNLLRQSVSIFFNRQTITEHISVLKKLVNQCSCYQLLAGRDLYDNPDTILNILPGNR